MSDSPDKSYDRPRRRWLWVLSSAVVIVSAAGGLFLLSRLPTTQAYFTDADQIREPAATTTPRDVLWQPPVLLSEKLNSGDQDYEPRLSWDGLTLYFVRGKAGEGANIYTAQRAVDGWSEPQPLHAVNSDADELGPEPTRDGTALYFYSNRDDGFGGYDLWVARREHDTWQAPQNLGPNVNSEFNDYGPAITPDATTLLFASNRPRPADIRQPDPQAWQATVREDLFSRTYDLYAARLTARGPSPAIAVDILNSPGNEGAPCISPAGNFVYFASDRPGGAGGFDLYRAWRVRGDFRSPASLGPTINTPANELDPGLGRLGYELVFSSDRRRVDGPSITDRNNYDLYRTVSREVFREVERTPRTPIDFAALWRQIGPHLLWALLALLALLLLWALMGDVRRRRLGLLTRCLLASLMVHALLMVLLNFWEVTAAVVDAVRGRGQIRVSLLPTAQASEISAQVRGDFTNVSLPEIDTAESQQQSAVVEPTDVRIPMQHLEAAPGKHELELTIVQPAIVAESMLSRASHAVRLPESLQTSPSQLDIAELPDHTPMTARETPTPVQPAVDARTARHNPMMPVSVTPTPARVHVPQTEALTDGAPRSSLAASEPVTTSNYSTASPRKVVPIAADVAVTPADALSVALPASLAPSAKREREDTTVDVPFAQASNAPPVDASPRAVESPHSVAQQLAVVGLGNESLVEHRDHSGCDKLLTSRAVSDLHADIDVELPTSSTLSVAGPRVSAPGATTESAPTMPAVQPGSRRAETTPPVTAAALLLKADTIRTPVQPAPIALTTPYVANTLREIDTSRVHPTLVRLPTTDVSPRHTPSPILQVALPSLAPTALVRRPLADVDSPDETEAAIALALRWLANHQQPDGSWHGREFDARCGGCDGVAEYDVNAALTSLAVLCFVGAGHTHTEPSPYQEVVASAISWLAEHQGDNGDLRCGETMYSHSLATLALSETLGVTRDAALRSAVQRAVQFAIGARDPRAGGWRYAPRDGSDTLMTGWHTMALKSAALAGQAVPAEVFAGVERWLRMVEDSDVPGLCADQPGMDVNPTATAAGMFIRQMLGSPRDDIRQINAGRVLAEITPTWDANLDTALWYFATLAQLHQGGAAWDTWNAALSAELIEHQETEGPPAGSWPVADEWSRVGGRVYQTALCTLMLEVQYRYLPMHRTAPPVGPPGTISGLITDVDTGLPIANATVRVDLSASSAAEAITNDDGHYELTVPHTPDHFAMSASHPQYVPESHSIPTETLREHGLRLDFALAPRSLRAIVIEAVPDVHHLGNDRFDGRVNSQFQKRSEGRSYVAEFEIIELPPPGTRVRLTMLTKGVQCPHPIRINGEMLRTRMRSSPADGSFGEFVAAVDPALLQPGVNEVLIRTSSCHGDLDDFEFVNVQLHFDDE